MNAYVDSFNAGTEVVAIASACLDIRTLARDRQVKGFNVWMKVYWFIYGIWQAWLAWSVGLPITSCVIVVWIPIYLASTVQTFYFRFNSEHANG